IIIAGKSRALIESQRDVIAMLARLEPGELKIETRAPAQPPAQALSLVAGAIEIYLPLAGMMDVEKEKARLAGEIEQTRAQITRAQQLLASEYSKKAPKDVVQKTRDQLAVNEEKVGKLDALLASLDGRVIAKSTKLGIRKARKKRKQRKEK